MKTVIQRVKNASVVVDNRVVGEIGQGLLVLLGITHDDLEKDVEWMVNKIVNMRIFSDDNDKMNLSLLDVNGEILVISQFTLYGDARKGNRPSFTSAAKPELAERLYNMFINKCIEAGIKTETGIFGADMKVKLENDGPVTLVLES